MDATLADGLYQIWEEGQVEFNGMKSRSTPDLGLGIAKLADCSTRILAR